MTGISIVIPTLGRPTLTTLLSTLATQLPGHAAAPVPGTTPAPAGTTGGAAAAEAPAGLNASADAGSAVGAGSVAAAGAAAAVAEGMSGAGKTAIVGRTPPPERTGLHGRTVLAGRTPPAGRTGPGASAGGSATPVEILVVDDRADTAEPLELPAGLDAKVLAGRGAGPAAARNAGWRAASHEWVAFLDDDVVPEPGWLAALIGDLAGAPARAGGVQGRLRVPLPAGRRPTDWERGTAALADGKWITADMAYRRAVLEVCQGFDERLPRAFREDAELAFRVRQAGWDLVRGGRTVTHPVRAEDRWVSVRQQRGNADDALLRRLYGPDWRHLLDIPPGRRARHAAVTAAGALTLLALAARRPRVAALTGALWAAGTAEFAAARVMPGPRTPREITTMLLTSAAIPPVAITWWLRGWTRWRGADRLESAR
ncbi:glycosyltransferase family 2 protein [Catenuloplanes indicus]|uniref:Glycosyltransferase 2-like domain-containing protein n=1 Tax=Catenuloplanes indicus TaxID=137267 RepID=A0AAE4AWS9_9ACTN|nr:glycosyltransferase [Catenuloplanes indicus]MDQ0365372.1 hypothetical protein [Catenuloplanes indicus]